MAGYEDTKKPKDEATEATRRAYMEKYGRIVEKLYAGDPDAWEAVYKHTVLAALRYKGNRLAKIAKDFGLLRIIYRNGVEIWDVYEIHNSLFLKMIGRGEGQDKLRLYDYRGDLYCWMCKYVKEIVLEPCKNRLLYEFEDGKTQILQNDSSDESENDSNTPYMSESEKEARLKEVRLQKLEQAVNSLFHSNPERAFILLLHGKMGLKFKAICSTVGLPMGDEKEMKSSINYVNHAYNQAVEKIREIMGLHKTKEE